MYLTQPEPGKNILQNEVPSDFVFILKMRKNPRNMIRTCDNILLTPIMVPPSQQLQLPSLRKNLNLVAGLCFVWTPGIENEVDNTASQLASQLADLAPR